MNKKITPIQERSKFMKFLLITAGTISVFIGLVGIVLPILPTTPFLLIAAACYVRSSEKLYNKLLENRYLGSYIKHYREQRAMTKKNKITAISILWATLSISIIIVSPIWVKILLVSIAIGVTIFLMQLRVAKEN
jgi:uncharacterized protein